jgi:hypothetical protein
MTDYMLGTSLQGGERDGRGLMWSITPRDHTTLAFMGAKDSAMDQCGPHRHAQQVAKGVGRYVHETAGPA